MRWKLVLRHFTVDPRVRGNALFDMEKDPNEATNLYYSKKYRKQLKGQLNLMLSQAENLQDELASKLAKAELAVVDNPDFKYELY